MLPMAKFGRILVVDDNRDILFTLNKQLALYSEVIKVALTPEKAVELCQKFKPDIVLMDMNFSRDAVSGEEGFALLKKLLRIDDKLAIIMMTAYSDTPKVVRAIKAGATDFLPKPWESHQLMAMVSSAMRIRRSQTEPLPPKEGKADPSPDIIGESTAMQELLALARQVAHTDANILILGENGTGKDVLARYIYSHSNRNTNPFVSIDLGSLPDALFEGELFGYEKGAFTGATTQKAGRLETANDGTLFLDEIGNLKTEMQAKLLTCIEKREFTRLGSNKSTPINVRFICATNMDIHKAVDEGLFRQDLLYRINTIELHIPPLRERITDIPLLANHFASLYANKYSKVIHGFSAELLKRMREYPWPGNVRELQHMVERAVILAKKPTLGVDDFPLDSRYNKKAADTVETLDLDTIEKHTIERALSKCDGNVSRAARLLGITRFVLYRKMERLGL